MDILHTSDTMTWIYCIPQGLAIYVFISLKTTRVVKTCPPCMFHELEDRKSYKKSCYRLRKNGFVTSWMTSEPLNGHTQWNNISFPLIDVIQIVKGVPKKWTSDFSSHHWHKYFTHMENKDRYWSLIILAFHAIFCFYSTPFQFVAIIRQGMSLPIFIHFILHLFILQCICSIGFWHLE